MKRQTIINKMMVLLISATMLVAGPGTGMFAFAEDDRSGAEDNAAVQTEGTTQSEEEQAQTEGSEEAGQQDMQEGSDGSGDAGDAAEGEDASDGADASDSADDAQKTAENGEEPGVTQDASENDAAQTQVDAAAAQDDAAAAQSDAAQTPDGAAAAQSDAAQTQDDAAQAQDGVAAAQNDAAPVVRISRTLSSTFRTADVRTKSAPVIKVGDAVYSSIEEAAAANPSGCKIEITSGEVSFDSDLSAVEYSISVGSSAALIIGANAALKSERGKNELIDVNEGGSLVVNGGNFHNDHGSAAVRVREGATAEFHGGTFTATYSVIDVAGHVTVVDGGRFMTPDGNTNNGATAMWVSGNGVVDEISGGEFTGYNTSGAGAGLMLTDAAHVGKISGGTFYGGTSANIYPSGGPNGFGIRIGWNPSTNTASVGEISGGTFRGGRCIELQSKSDLKITGGTAEGIVENGEKKSFQGVHVDITGKASIEGLTINNVRTGIANYGIISKIDGVDIKNVNTGIINQSAISSVSNSTIDANYTGIGLAPYSRSASPEAAIIEELKDNDVHVADGCAVEMDEGSVIGEINGGTYSTDLSSSNEAVILNSGEIGSIKGGTFTSKDNYYTICNYFGGKIGEISGGTFTSEYASSIIRNRGVDSSIGKISGGTFTSPLTSYIVCNDSGVIGEISGGNFSGGNAALYNKDGSIEKISGGSFAAADNGWFGIYNIGEDSSIAAIEIAEGANSVFRGPYAAIASYNGAGLGKVDGYGIFLGGNWGTLYTDANVPLEKGGNEDLDLTKEQVNPGFGRYADNEAILEGYWNIPEGYHMSATKLLIPEMDDEVIDETRFAFLAKDNTIIYSGNGHELVKGSAAKGFRDTGLMFRDYATASAEVEDNDAEGEFCFNNDNREFLGWNTRADGSGTMYKAGDKIDFSDEAFADGSDILLYAQWGEEETPAAPGNDEPEDPETPAAAPAARTEVPVTQTVAAVPAAAAVPETTDAAAPAAMAAAPASEPEGEVLEDPEVPLAAPETQTTQKAADVKGWALVNLITAVMTVLGAAYACIRRRKEDGSKGSAAMKLGGVVAAAASVITFFMNENLAGPMSITDSWTVIMIFILGAQIATAVAAGRLEGSKKDQEA